MNTAFHTAPLGSRTPCEGHVRPLPTAWTPRKSVSPKRCVLRMESAREPGEKSVQMSDAAADLTMQTEAGATSIARASGSGSPSTSDIASTAGLKSTPLGSGVQNATVRYSLPEPTLAVRNLIEGAQYAHLCTNMSNMHHRRAGYPFGMLVDFAADGAGYPIFCLSPLSIHSHNIHEDPRCSLVVQMPGWTGLSNARITIFGDVYELPNEMQEAAKEIFLSKHHGSGQGQRVISDSFRFYRMNRILDIYFVGGFGTMQWVNVAEYAATKPDAIVMYHPHDTIEALSDEFGEALTQMYAGEGGASDATFISIDATGADVRVRQPWECTVHRLPFREKVYTPEQARREVAAALAQSA